MTHGINWWHLGSAYKDAPAIGWLSLTFLIFVFIIVRMVKKPLHLYLETRSKDIQRLIEEGEKAQQESSQRLREFEEKLSLLDSEVEKIKEDFFKQAEAEKRELKRLMQEQREKVLKEADDTIKASLHRSRLNLAHEVINVAINQAKEKLAAESDKVDSHLRQMLIEDIKKSTKEIRA